MARYLLDTNHASPLVTLNHPLRARVIEQMLQGDQFFVTANHLSEILAGLLILPRAASNLEQWTRLESEIGIFAFSSEDARNAAYLQVALRKQAAVTLTASLGGAARSVMITVMPAASTDTVSISRAEYRSGTRRLTINAASSNATATLRVHNTASNALIGTLTNNGGGNFSGTFTVTSNPGNITVRSSAGGSASRVVTVR